MTRQTFTLILFLSFATIYGQEIDIVHYLRTYRLDSVRVALPTLENDVAEQLRWQLNFLETFDITSTSFKSFSSIKEPKEGTLSSYFYAINKGDYLYYGSQEKNIDALTAYRKALAIATTKKDTALQCEALKKILTVHRLSYLYDNETYKTYLKQYESLAYDDLEKAYYNYYNLILNFKNYKVDQWDDRSYKALKSYFQNTKRPFLQGKSETVFASYFEEIKQLDSTVYFMQNADRLFMSITEAYKDVHATKLNAFKARIYLKTGDYSQASYALEAIPEVSTTKLNLQFLSLKNYYTSVLDTVNNNWRAAYDHYGVYELLQDSINKVAFTSELNDLETKYQSAKKEKALSEQRIKNQQLIWGLGGGITAVVIIALLTYRNVKRKERLANQEKELNLQKTAIILKEKEIDTINAMVAGQEKERQRLASDLHDNIGSTLATVKMHVDNLQRNLDRVENPRDLLQKTNLLIDEAYTQVRQISHERNAGVLAQDGLLPTLKKLAKTVSTANGVVVHVQDFGLDKRLSNEIEITIFRIIQELITNVVKHAQAKEATISLTQHDNELSIIVEDDGVGFKPGKLIEKNGMGLGSIERRVEHLDGSMQVDSSPKNGTTILIDIPL